jgi:[amino group carrier protein]-lysine/ornithine hydrolase
MVDIPSPSGREALVADFAAERMTEYGFATRIDAAGNVIGEIGDPLGPIILLLGHIDTVPGGPLTHREGDLLYGRGAVDAKGAFATMICAAARVGPDLKARLRVAGAVDEERLSAGARQLLGDMDARGERPAAVVIGEPSGTAAIVVGYKGIFRFRLRVRASAHHTSSPEDTAAELAVGAWQQLSDWLSALRPPGGPLFGRAIPTITGFRADLERAAMDVSCRVPPGFDADAFSRRLREIASDQGQIDVLEWVPAVRVSQRNAAARALHESMRSCGLDGVSKVKLGTSDMNLAVPHWGVPTVAYGPGDSHRCHSADEHIDLREYMVSIDVLAGALVRLAAGIGTR